MQYQCPQCGRTIRYEGLCLNCREENKQKEILSLSDEELAAKTAEVTADGFDEDLCRLLIRLRGINTEKLAEYAWQRRIFNCPEVYKDMSDETAAAMIEELRRDDLDSLTANKLLICLSHKGGEIVRKAFLELENDPREWRKSRYFDPSDYANYGGWTYGKDGAVIRTAFDRCYRVVKTAPEQRAQSPVKLVTAADGVCPDCGCKYVNLIEIDGRDKRLDFLGTDGKIAVKCCPNCAPFDDRQLCRYDLNGGSEMIPAKGHGLPVDDNDWVDEAAENTFALGDPVSVYFPCGWDSGSAVGGRAFWINDCVIEKCPDCGKPMIFLAQIGEEPLGYEGNFYVEICRDCKIAAVLYQQT